MERSSLDGIHREGNDLGNSQYAVFPSGHGVRLDTQNLGKLHLGDSQSSSPGFQFLALHALRIVHGDEHEINT